MALDTAALIFALGGQSKADEALERLDNLPTAMKYKGAVDTYDDLPSSADEGDVYTVLENEKEYVWGNYQGTNQWIELGGTIVPYIQGYGINIDSDNKISVDTDVIVDKDNIKTINGNSLLGTGNLDIKTYQPFPDGEIYADTLEDLVIAIENFPDRAQGMAYLGGIDGGCVPFEGNAECKVTFMGDTSPALIEVNSADISPYNWYYNTADGTYVWKANETQENKVTEISDESTDDQYPSAKCVYDYLNAALNEKYGSVKIDTSITTMGDLKDFIDGINNEGQHCLFDFSDHIDGAYVCLITSTSVDDSNFMWISDLLNNKVYGSYSGYNDSDDIDDYLTGVNIQTGVRTISLSDVNMTLGEVLDLLDRINLKGDSVFFSTGALGSNRYLCTIFIDKINQRIRITDQVTGGKFIGAYDATKTFKSCLDEMIEDICVLSVDCKSMLAGDSIDVNGAEITIKNAVDEILGTKIYNGTPLTFPLPLNQTYKVVAKSVVKIEETAYFNPSANNQEGVLIDDTFVHIIYQNPGSMETIQDIETFIRICENIADAKDVLMNSKNPENNFSCDITLSNPDNSTEVVTMPVIVEDVRIVKGEDGQNHNGVIFGFKYAMKDSLPFDEQEILICLPTDTFDNNHTYFTATSSSATSDFTNITDFVEGQTIEDYMSTHSGIYVYKNGLKLDSTGYKDTPTNILNVLLYGSNILHYSNVYKYLNGMGDNWFAPSYDGDVLASAYTNKKGFKSWWKPEDLACVKKVYYPVYERAGFELPNNELCCEFILPSKTEVAGVPDTTGYDGTVFERWLAKNGGEQKNDANSDRTFAKINAPQTAVTAWLRTPLRGSSSYPWLVDSSGSVTYGSARYAYGVAPIFTIY